MSKKVLFPLIAVFTFGVAAGSVGCAGEVKIGNPEPKAATPPPPPAPPPPPKEEPKPAEAPPPKPIRMVGKAKLVDNKIEIPGKIHFDTDKATLKEDKETKEILQTVADVLKQNENITKLRIDGHTDDTGGADHNVKLSNDRAAAVADWLVKNGVDKARLDSKGYGQDRPLVKNDSATNREQNRRVEFRLWELGGKPTDAQKNDATATATAPAGANPIANTAAKPDDKKAATPAPKK
jgi:outer membrane protein OmpA-like peptidoglycan-associated protein